VLMASLPIGFEEHLLERGVHQRIAAPDGRKAKIQVVVPKCPVYVLDFRQVVRREFQLVRIDEDTLYCRKIFLKKLRVRWRIANSGQNIFEGSSRTHTRSLPRDQE